MPWLGLRDDQEGPTTPPIPPHPERSTDGPWLGPDDNYPTTTTAGAPHRSQRRCHLVHDNHAPSLGRSTDGTWPDNPTTAQPLAKEDPTTNLRKTKNRIQQTDIDGEM